MALPHYSEDQTSKKGKNFEPVQANLFEVTILPPDGVSGQELLLQHVKSISGLDAMHKDVAAIEQKYKFATRSYAGMTDQTALDITVAFTLNLNDSISLIVSLPKDSVSISKSDSMHLINKSSSSNPHPQ